MDEAKLQEIEARANAATPGPWGADCAEGMRSVLSGGGLRALVVPWVSGALLSQGDSAFIAAARTDVPALVAEARQLRAELATVTAERDRLRWGVVANAGRTSVGRKERWAYVKDAVGCGSTRAAEMCVAAGFDPDDECGIEPEPDEDDDIAALPLDAPGGAT